MRIIPKKYLSKDDLKFLSSRIAEAELTTSGEIRVVLLHRRKRRERKLSLEELAVQEFHKLGMQKTAGRTGVLILLLFSEQKFHIAADEGIHAKVEDGTWDRVAAVMSGHFRKGHFRRGIADAIAAVGSELSKHFPRQADDQNELPDDIIER
jgi:uncharacterized membrane protein